MKHQSGMAKKRENLFNVVTTTAEQRLTELLGNPETARLVSREFVTLLYDTFKGQNFSFPMAQPDFMTPIDEKIYADFKGNNYAEIASKFGITEGAAYRIIARQQKRIDELRRANQGTLFEGLDVL